MKKLAVLVVLLALVLALLPAAPVSAACGDSTHPCTPYPVDPAPTIPPGCRYFGNEIVCKPPVAPHVHHWAKR